MRLAAVSKDGAMDQQSGGSSAVPGPTQGAAQSSNSSAIAAVDDAPVTNQTQGSPEGIEGKLMNSKQRKKAANELRKAGHAAEKATQETF